MDPWLLAPYLDLAEKIWWAFLAAAGLLAAVLIGLNLRALKKRPPDDYFDQ